MSKKHKFRHVQVFFLLIVVLSLFFVTNYSRFLWETLPLIKFLLYPWRFLGLAAFVTATLTALLISNLKRLKLASLVLLVIIAFYTNRHYTKVDQFIPNQISQILLEGNATTQNEFDPIWLSQSSLNNIKPEIEPLEQFLSIENATQSPLKLAFTTKSKEAARIKIGRIYFPGWQVNIDGKKASINPDVNISTEDTTQDLRGLIVLEIPKGTHQVKVIFKETPVRRVGNLITLASAVMVIYIFVKQQNIKSLA